METSDRIPLEKRPGIFIIGSSNVGKRTLISRLLSVDFEDASDSLSELLVNEWTINTKYYTADVSLWMTHLHEGFSIDTLPVLDSLAALVMVFDLTEPTSLDALKNWVSCTEIQKFEILLCIGNKVDLLPGHPVHAEYRRRLLTRGDPSDDRYNDLTEYGITEAEGSSLLGDKEPSREIGKSCLEWCIEHNIEYIEACASNVSFDKCLSVDGDSQGVERLYGALSAYMWPGMVLKSGYKITEPSLPEEEELSEEESEYEFEYEVLSAGSADPWEVTDEEWVSAKGISGDSEAGPSVAQNDSIKNSNPDTGNSVDQNTYNTESYLENVTRSDDVLQPSTSWVEFGDEVENEVVQNTEEAYKESPFDFEDLEQLISEIGNMRDNLRLMPDFQRREMAAKLAMKMASMFGDGSDDEEGSN